MTSFSLYDLLFKKCNNGNTDINLEDIKELVDNVKKLDKEGYELLFMLIRTNNIHENKNNSEIPFEGQRINIDISSYSVVSPESKQCDIKFDIRKFSPILRKILLEFSRMHLQEMKLKKN